MRILVIGATGMLGHKLVQALGERFQVFSSVRSDFQQIARYKIFEPKRTFTNVDVQDIKSVETVIFHSRPDVVINAVGVVKHVLEAHGVVKALEINSLFPHRLATLGAKYQFRLITISTDCVFSGTKGGYTEADTVDALDLYGQSKHWGEVDGENCLTIRTSIIGRELQQRHGLLEWFISNRGGTVPGFTNAVFSGFPTYVFADIIGEIVEKHPGLSGVFHISSIPISKFELLSKINNKLGLDITIEKFDDFVLDRSLDCAKFKGASGFVPMPWSEMIDVMISDPTPYQKWNSQMS